MSIERTGSRLRSYHVRSREALLVTGDFRSVAGDLQLHLMSCGIEHEESVEEVLVDGLTALGFHLVARSADEYVGWTVHGSGSAVSFFLTGNGREGSLVGRAFESDAEFEGEDVLISQAKRPGASLEETSTAIEGSSFFGYVEQYYCEVVQRPARFYRGSGHERAFLVALPGGDRAWVENVRDEVVFALPESEDVRFLADRVFAFHCGCDHDKISKHLVASYGETPEALFGDGSEVRIPCPRCGARYRVTPEDYERFRHPGASPR